MLPLQREEQLERSVLRRIVPYRDPVGGIRELEGEGKEMPDEERGVPTHHQDIGGLDRRPSW
jgi:hypothetical protein